VRFAVAVSGLAAYAGFLHFLAHLHFVDDRLRLRAAEVVSPALNLLHWQPLHAVVVNRVHPQRHVLSRPRLLRLLDDVL